MTNIDRRRFLGAAVATAALAGAAPAADDKKPRLKKAVKFGMIRIDAPIKDKFELIKSLGFLGVEIDSPSGLDLKEANKAQEDTGIKIRGLAALETALKAANTVGADTVLLVPGVVNKDATYEQCRERSQTEVRKVLPLAEKLNVKIAIEVVWNNFITKPEQLIEYVDAFKSPHVGAYFDCSNMVKYGVKSGDWIRKLGQRMLKFDFKGYSKTKGWVPIGEGDEDWPDILEALKEVGYNGWATAEVAGGRREELQDVAERMNRILGLGG
jgi:L-ribulose-5-phosphate 3-epimerase